jgi:hypothetical protein
LIGIPLHQRTVQIPGEAFPFAGQNGKQHLTIDSMYQLAFVLPAFLLFHKL